MRVISVEFVSMKVYSDEIYSLARCGARLLRNAYGILRILNAHTCRVGALECMLQTLEIVSMKVVVDEILYV